MILIKNGHICPIIGEELPCGDVLIGDDGKISAIGESIVPTERTEVIDVKGRLVTPGCVEAHCHIGIGEPLIGWAGHDYNERSEPVTPHMRAIDGINPFSSDFADAIRGGVTTAAVAPGSANVIGGTVTAIKLVGRRIDDMIIKDPVAMKCALGENPKNCYGQQAKKAPFTRMAISALMRETLYRARTYAEEKESGKEGKFDLRMEALVPVVRGELPLKVHAHRADDIFTAIRIAHEFGLKLTLDHCTEGHLIADALACEGFPVLIGPSYGGRSKAELEHKSFITPGILHAAGVEVSIITDAGVSPIENLPMFAGMAANAGLPLDAAWRAITINPAKALGIADRVGSLEAGKDADVVVWTADPLSTIGGEAHITVVDGKIVYRA